MNTPPLLPPALPAKRLRCDWPIGDQIGFVLGCTALIVFTLGLGTPLVICLFVRTIINRTTITQR
jgi:hypothetical protein